MFESMPRLDLDVQQAYLARLGVSAEPPSVAGLQLLVQRHAERVPYETLWIHAGEAWNIDPYESATRIALHGRGGYCYHMNGALGLLLSSLGYAVCGHVGGVHGPEGPDAAAMGNHLVLTVGLLPSDANPGGVWYVDAGLGDALHDPLPLVAGRHDQPPFGLSLEPAADKSGWHLTHDPGGGFTGMTWTLAHARWADFEAKHHWLSTSPESGFVQVAMAERRDATGVDVIRGLVLSRIGDGARTAEPVTRRAEWFDLLADLFDLRLHSMTPEARDRLWTNVRTAHRRWQETQASQSP
ncbi:arylamine N-acetyltransferase [Micromonospora sp. NPDC093277]|uniref:arylamine N-acetyltransferase family protein n=1 Tax=Micromonospora sp. NPDC093277 TaxID=3364291 RepID=UPI003813C50F